MVVTKLPDRRTAAVAVAGATLVAAGVSDRSVLPSEGGAAVLPWASLVLAAAAVAADSDYAAVAVGSFTLSAVAAVVGGALSVDAVSAVAVAAFVAGAVLAVAGLPGESEPDRR